jgi:hypothetical protein
MLFEPVLLPFDQLVNAGQFRWLIDHRAGAPVYATGDLDPILDEVEAKAVRLLEGINAQSQGGADPEPLAAEIRAEVGELLGIANLGERLPQPFSRKADQSLTYLLAGTGEQDASPIKTGDAATWGTLLGWLLTHRLGEFVKESSPAEASRQWLDEHLLGKRLSGVFNDLGADQETAQRAARLVSLLITHQNWMLPKDLSSKAGSADPGEALRAWLADTGVQRFIGVNRYQDVVYFNKEGFEQWLWWMFTVEAVQAACQVKSPQKLAARLVSAYGVIQEILQAETRSGYQIDGLISALQPESK